LTRRLELPEPAPAATLARLSFYPWLVVGTVCIGVFMGQADASIVQLAMPALEDAFDAPLGAVSWVAVGYVVAFASVLPAFARLAEIAGRKTLYLAGFALFGVCSALCALSADLGWLIAFRVLLGASGALLGANSVVVLVAAAGAERRGKALGIMAAAQAVGLSAGPALGGVLLGAFGWRAIFWVAIPGSIVGVALGWLIIPKTAKFSGDTRFDFPGAVLLAPALAALLLAITETHAWGLSPALMICAAAAPVLFAAFAWRELSTPAPLVDLRLFRSPAFSAGSVGVLLAYGMLYGIFFAMSFALVRGYHDPPLAAGLRLTVVPIALGVTAPFAGAVSDKRPRLVMLIGMGVCAASALALTGVMTGTPASLPLVMVGLAGFGVGLGFYIAPNNSSTMGAAPAEKSGVAGGLLNLLRVFGMGFGVSVASATLSWRLEAATGLHDRTANVREAALLGAVAYVLVLLAIGAALSAAMAAISGAVQGGPEVGAAARPAPQPTRG
jgi:EmrB/QacA subfamily drug resistance transporter